MSDEPKLTLKKIKRHLEDHPGYYHEEDEIKYLYAVYLAEKEAHDKANEIIKGLSEKNKLLQGEYDLVKIHADAVDETVQKLGELSLSIHEDMEKMLALQKTQEAIYYKELARNTALQAKINTLFAAIEHGSNEHKDWLKNAIETHFAEE